ncbi:helix-turn-helix domain-containing protein [Pontibacter sp. SGAir0037]|uniref:helix-turn-helix domain-containing protein n=1 Tax=Pontibacter sp. SGAir0037 TaxID=2571030 RepID=UPI0010CCD730|nr:helix-turn-helix domain-containing protein [Pontibacter sp. SGAir0037]QCR24762.1 hypothetical protein C1N53_21990 [Pontibacter sp. SGAir0037]
MQKVVIIPEVEWEQYQQKLIDLEKRLQLLENGLTEYVGTNEACRITGIGRNALYNARIENKIECKYEGRKVCYLRSSLLAYNESKRPRKGN